MVMQRLMRGDERRLHFVLMNMTELEVIISARAARSNMKTVPAAGFPIYYFQLCSLQDAC